MESNTRFTTEQHSSINYPNNQTNLLVNFKMFGNTIWLLEFQVACYRYEELILLNFYHQMLNMLKFHETD